MAKLALALALPLALALGAASATSMAAVAPASASSFRNWPGKAVGSRGKPLWVARKTSKTAVDLGLGG